MVLQHISPASRVKSARLTIVLCYLIARRLILVKVVLPVEAAPMLDLTVQGQSCTQRRQKRFLLEMGLSTREGGIEKCYVRIRRGIGRCCGTGEELPGGVELGVDLNADRELPFLQSRAPSFRSVPRGA